MKLEEFTKEKAKTFVISWSVIFFLFGLLVAWALISTYEIQQQDPLVPPSAFWPHYALISFVLFSLLIGVIAMWKKYLSGEYEKIRRARNISFIVVLILYPLGVILNLFLAGAYW